MIALYIQKIFPASWKNLMDAGYIHKFDDFSSGLTYNLWIHGKSPGDPSFSYCDHDADLSELEERRVRRMSEDRFKTREIDFAPFGALKLPNLAGVRNTMRVSWLRNREGTSGYEDATIDLTYRFLSCADEIVMAYAIDPKSVQVGERYWSQSANAWRKTSGADVPTPSSVELRGHIRLKDALQDSSSRLDKAFYDEFAGDALGEGCFTGQTQRVGFTKQLVGSSAKPEQIKAFLDGLVLTQVQVGDGPLQNAALDGKAAPTHLDFEADRLARERAEAERLAAEKAEAEYRARVVGSEVARARAAAQKTLAETKAYQEGKARYEREMAAKRAADEKYARDMAAFEAEKKRIDAERAEYDRKMAEYNKAVANKANR